MVTGVVRCYPIIYYNEKARNATLNYLRALPSVLQWIGACLYLSELDGSHTTFAPTPSSHPPPDTTTASEFFLITVYACACVLLYSDADRTGRSGQEAFKDFGEAFVNLYSLSLTVTNPNLYLVRRRS
jgi:hypothetical protein